MGYEKHKNIITGFDAGNVISDEYCTVTYAALNGMLAELDVFFDKYEKHKIGCVGVFMQNSVLQAVVIVYLLSEKINFFLYTGNGIATNNVPFFCDTILTAVSTSQDSLNVSASLCLNGNPAYVKKQTAPPSGAGYVFFSSSGSSGPSKYVRFNSVNLINNAKKCIKRFSVCATSRLLITVPVSHMYGMGVGMLPALITGASMCLIEKNNVIKLYTHIAAFNPDITLITPTLAKMVLILNKNISGNRMYITAGEKIDTDTHRNFESKYGLLVNLYGCTELGAVATSLMDDIHAESRGMGAVHPLDDVRILISNGPANEILVHHDAGFDGYVDNEGRIYLPELTSQSYYRTKDAGVDTGNGGFIVSGRVDNCVNRSGFLISLDEVESKLKSMFDNFRQVVVFEGHAANGVTPRLIAVCEITDEIMPDGQLVKAQCNTNMGRYAVPDEFIFVEQMPRLNNGKVDRLLIKKNCSTQ